MAVGEGKFVLYSRIEPPLEAGDYRLTATQTLGATTTKNEALGTDALPVAPLPTHLRVRAPRYQLPPDQVLSTFPPANTEGAYGMRLPQVVMRRRTLPWERRLTGQPRATPWLALVVIAEGEAELKLNQPVAQCVTPGVSLGGVADVERGNALHVRQSVVHRLFPTRRDVPLLAHAREVDVHDTELMMGDDDGFLAVVIANRLPLPGRDASGDEVPVKYLACLVNLEGQFDALLPESPPPQPFTLPPLVELQQTIDLATLDHRVMGRAVPPASAVAASSASIASPAGGTRALAPDRTVIRKTIVAAHEAAAPQAVPEVQQWSRIGAGRTGSDVYVEMARDFAGVGMVRDLVAADPTLRFPVLLHWSFTSTGSTTFRTLMEQLDSGLLGTVPNRPNATAEPPAGRPPLELVETGHVGLVHRTRRGESARVWYRGPCVAHPTADPPGGRLTLAHAADQLRIVVPDGREDLSLAGAFEIGRLMALARPSMVAALLRWRQVDYQTARRQSMWELQRGFLAELLGAALPQLIPDDLGVHLGRALARAVAAQPSRFVGPPRPLVTPGRAVLPAEVSLDPVVVMATGLALPTNTLQADLPTVLETLRGLAPPVAPLPNFEQTIGGPPGGPIIRPRAAGKRATTRTAAGRAAEAAREAAAEAARLEAETLAAALDALAERLADDALANEAPVAAPADDPVNRRSRGGARSRAAGARAAAPAPGTPDALDALLARTGPFAPTPDDDAEG